MEIFNHIIKTEEIIGISPLYAQPSKDPAMRSLYNSFRYVFEVHCKSRSIEITSDYFLPGEGDKAVAKYMKWEHEYYTERDKIKELLKEPISTSAD